MSDIDKYIVLLQVATKLSEELADIIRTFAIKQLTPEDFDKLEAAWTADIARSARNAELYK